MLLILMVLITAPAFAQLSTCISFVKQNYQANEPIQLEFEIINQGVEEQSFILSDVLPQSIRFELKSSRNESIPMSRRNIIEYTEVYANPALYRTITLLPNESFGVLFNLRNLYDITAYETYYIRSTFYPNPDNRADFVESDYTSFSHTPSPLVIQTIVEESIIRQNQIMALSRMLPSEIIASFFNAQFERDWDKFLLHISLSQLIQSFHNFSVPYDRSTDSAFKLELIEQFKRFLTVHWDMPITSYNIVETIIRDDTATVTVDAVESIGFTSRRLRYYFTLLRSASGAWLISDYSVLALN